MCKICFLPSFFRSILRTNVYPFNSGFDWLWNIRLYKLLSNKQINMCFACLRQPEQWCLDFHQSFLSLLKLIWVSYWSAEPQGLQFAKCFPTFDECRKPKIKGNITATYRPAWNEDYHRHASSITHWNLYTEFAILAKISADLRFLVLTLKSAKIDDKNPQSASFMRVKFANLDLKGSMMNFKTRCLYQSDLPSWDSLMHGFPMTHGVK